MLNMFKSSFKPDPSDFIIVIMGPTGAGKSNFINHLTGLGETRNARNLKSDTKDVTPYIIYHHDGFRVVLVDTPGFDDTYRSDTDVLRTIANRLTQRYPGGETLRAGGIAYLHRITDKRMSGSVYKNLQMFGRLCGDLPLRRVRLVTTMWDTARDRRAAEQREKELKDDFWKDLISDGAVMRRFDNTPASAQVIQDELLVLGKDGDELLLQEELVEQGKRLNETEAGKVLYSRFQQLLVEQRKTLKELADEARNQNDPALAKSLQEEYEKINEQLQKTFEEMKEMKIPFLRRFALLFKGKSRGQAVKYN